jgi:Flp pilus assembly protein TadB
MGLANLSNIDFILVMGSAVVLVCSCALAAAAFTAWRGAARRQSEQMQAQHRALLEQLAQICARVDSTDRQVRQLGEQLEQSAARAASTPRAASGYQIAIRLARSGASAEELAGGCGLTRAEADLVRRLHGPAPGELRQAS